MRKERATLDTRPSPRATRPGSGVPSRVDQHGGDRNPLVTRSTCIRLLMECFGRLGQSLAKSPRPDVAPRALAHSYPRARCRAPHLDRFGMQTGPARSRPRPGRHRASYRPSRLPACAGQPIHAGICLKCLPLAPPGRDPRSGRGEWRISAARLAVTRPHVVPAALWLRGRSGRGRARACLLLACLLGGLRLTLRVAPNA